VDAKPKAAIYTGTPELCIAGNVFKWSDQSTISSGTLTSWNWAFGDNGTSTNQNPTHTYAAIGTYKVTLKVTSTYGCTDTVSYYTKVNPMPVAGFKINSSAECLQGNSFTLSDTSTGKATWFWTMGNRDTSVGKTPVYSYKTPGTYKITQHVITDKGCADTTSKTVTVYPHSNLSFIVNSYGQCLKGNSFSFTGYGTNATSNITSWLYDFGDGQTSTLQNPTHTYSASGIYMVKLRTTTVNGCIDSISSNITVYPQPMPSFSVDKNSQCLNGNSFSFSDSSRISSGNIKTWIYDFGDGNGAISQNTSYSYKATGIYFVKLTTTSDNGCTETSSKSISVHGEPQADYKINKTVQCFSGNHYAFTDNSLSMDSVKNWSWNFGDSTISMSQNPTHAYKNPGTYTVNFIAETGAGCTDKLSKKIKILPKPKAAFTIGNKSQCLSGNSFSFTNKSLALLDTINSLAWNFGDGNISNLKNPVNSYTNAGQYNVNLIITTNNGCKDSILDTVTVYPMPNPVIYGQGIICKGLSGTYSTTPIAGSKYNWIVPGGNALSAKDSSAIKINWPDSASVKMYLYETNSFGCQGVQSKTVNILPTSKPVISGPVQLCGEGKAIYQSPATAGYSYLWNSEGGTIISGQNTSQITVNWDSLGTHHIKEYQAINNGCLDSGFYMITILKKPKANFKFKNECVSDTFKFLDSSIDAVSYLWDFGDSTSSTSQNPTHSFPKSGI